MSVPEDLEQLKEQGTKTCILATGGMTVMHTIYCRKSLIQNSVIQIFTYPNNQINILTTNDDYSHHRNLAACYQLVQSVLKIGSALAEKVGQREVGG